MRNFEVKVKAKHSFFGEIHHANLCGIEVPSFNTREKAIGFCEKQNWEMKDKGGRVYELVVHSF